MSPWPRTPLPLAADRFGRSAAVVTALTTSGACCLLSPLALRAPASLLALFLGV